MATRRERVVLDLEDNFTSGMARAAAAAALLDKNLNSLSGSSVQTSRDADKVQTSIKGVGDEVDRTSEKTRRGAADINQYSGRLRLLTEAAVTLGPALVPIGAVAVPATLALAAGLGAAAGAAGVAILAFNGVGDALSALDDYQLAPTTANLEKMNEAMAAVGPAGASFVMFLDSLEPQLKQVQELARLGLLPGAEAGLASLMTMLPQVRELVFSLSTAVGDLAADAGAALAGDAWRPFFDYLQTDAAPLLTAFAHSLGNVGEGLGSLLVAFGPLSRDFASGMEAMTASFADWAAGLSETDGFRSFVAYVRESGPQVLALLGSLASAMVDIAVAAAPVASAVLPVLTTMAKILSTIAGSPIGPPLFTAAAAMLALSRATSLASAAMAKFSASTAAGQANLSKLGTGLNFAAILAGLGAVNAAFNQLDDRVSDNDLNRNLEALSRGEAVDNLNNLGDALSNATSGYKRFSDVTGAILTLNFDDSQWEKAKEDIEKVDQALAGFVESGQAEMASQAFDQIMKQAEASGVSAEDAAAQFDAYNTALENAAPTADEAAASQKQYADALNASARVNRITRAQVEGLNAAMEEQTSAALGAFDAVTQYARALDEAQKRAKNTSAGLDATTEAGRKNRDLMSQVAAAWNNQSDAVRNNVGKWREARKSFIDTAVAMGAPIKQARNLADRLLEIPKQRQIDIKLYGAEEAANALERVRNEMASIKDKTVRLTYYVNQVNAINKGGYEPNPDARGADGMTVPGERSPYGDKVLAYIAPGEEVVSNRYGQADRHRALLKAINANQLADGGTVGGRQSLEDQLAIAQIMAQIRDYRRSLGKDGKDKLEGLNRRIAELQLKAAEKELRLAETRAQREAKQEARERLLGQRDALSGLAGGPSFDSLLPNVPQTVAQGVAAEIAAFQAEILDAGGTWTRELREWARDMRQTAQAYDSVTAAIETETAKRDALVETLSEQQSQLDELNRTMAAFSASVSSNFLNNGFNRSMNVTRAASPELAQAQAQLAAIQASGGPGASAQASRLMQQIAMMQPQEQTLTGLDALRETLTTDTQGAKDFAAALQQLVSQGLDPTGGLYQKLAQEGDLLTAQQLSAAGSGAIDELEAMWQERDRFTAELAAQTTQAAFGQQHAQAVAAIDHQNALIAQVDATLTVLNATQVVLAEQLRVGPEQVATLIQPQIDSLNLTLATLPSATARELRSLIRQAGGK